MNPVAQELESRMNMRTPSDSSARPFDRRDFVRTSAAALGSLAVAPLATTPSAGALSPLPRGRAVPRSPGANPIRIGLIGCGGRGTGAAVQALSSGQDVQLVAMADAFADRVDACYGHITGDDLASELGPDADIRGLVDVPESRRYAGFDAYEKVLPHADVVILATPPGFRPMHFEAAIGAGLDVFMEKPVATDAPGVRKVLAVHERAVADGRNVVVGLQRHYQTVYREWVDRIHGGMIGDLVLGRVYWNSGGVWVRPREEGQTEMEYQMRNWYYFNWLCGDHIVEQHIHNLDVGNWVLDGHPIRAQGQGGRQVRDDVDHGEIYDHHFVELEYEGGARVLSQCRHIPGCMNRVSEGFHGTGGAAPRPGLIVSASGDTLWEHDDADDPNPYQVEHDELFAAIAGGEHRYSDAERGAVATMTAILGRMATYSGQVVEWDEALASDLSLMPARYAWDAPPPVLPDEKGRYPIPTPGVTRAL
ncbi:MAG: Gfo/Idh/MocA family oxidoreductase [Gemmatimonadota bacterium]|nr:Gfo/Idh/MocA family oxidoreductase [Gemmatimonadota bacterium]